MEKVQDHYSHVDYHISNEIDFMTEIEMFMKERAQIEKEYSKRLGTLSNKYSTRLRHRKVIPFNDSAEQTTLVKCWTGIVKNFETLAQKKNDLATKIEDTTFHALVNLAKTCDESRKRHDDFHTQIVEKLLEDSHHELTNQKDSYAQKCKDLELALNIVAKLEDEKNKKLLQSKQLDWKNKKNDYILRLSFANATVQKYWKKDYPFILDSVQQLDQKKTEKIRDILQGYLSFEEACLKESTEISALSQSYVSSIEAGLDSSNFFDAIRSKLKEPEKLIFQSPLAIDKFELANDTQSRNYLINCYLKVKKEESDLEERLSQKQKEIDGLKELADSYRQTPEMGDEENVLEKMAAEKRILCILETDRNQKRVQVDELLKCLGDDIIRNIKEHKLKHSSFLASSKCDYCHSGVWGLGKVGFICEECSLVCHDYCLMLLPANCNEEISYRKAKKEGLKLKSKTKTMSVCQGAQPLETPALMTEEPKAVLKSIESINASQKIMESRKGTIRNRQVKALAMDTLKNMPVSFDNLFRKPGMSVVAAYNFEADSEGEITISAGETLEIIEDDGSGWVKVRNSSGKEGLVPGNYVNSQNNVESDNSHFVVIFDFVAENEGELNLKLGDTLTVTNRFDDGWWEGECKGQRGLFPSNYVAKSLEK